MRRTRHKTCETGFPAWRQLIKAQRVSLRAECLLVIVKYHPNPNTSLQEAMNVADQMTMPDKDSMQSSGHGDGDTGALATISRS